jgi:KDO2-lipid IV(A) lauroyltransferase
MEGYAAGGIMRSMRDKRAEGVFLKSRNRYHVKTIYSQPRRECVDTTIRCLRNNEIIFIPLDQNFGTGGIFVNFFGQKAATATGPVILSQRTGAALVPCFIVRQPDDTHRVIFEPPIQMAAGSTPEETIALNIQKLTDIIESYIRRYPAEWGWVHRRWKSKPKEQHNKEV